MPGAQVQDAARARRRIWFRLTLAALLVSLAGLVFVTLRFDTAAESVLQHVDEQAALSIRLRQLQGVLVALVDAESAQRGYLLTNDAALLAPYRDAVGRLPLLMRGLEAGERSTVDTDRAAGEARLAIADKLAQLAESVRLQGAGRHDEAMALLMSDKGRDDSARARGAVNAALDSVRGARDAIGEQIAAGVSHIQHLLLLAVSSLLVFILLAVGQALQALGARSRFEAALTASEQRHRALVEDQSELVSLAREDGTLVYVNPAYARHFRRTPAELVGTSFYDLIEESEREAVRLQVSGVMRTGRERSGENRNLGPDGSLRWVAWTNKRRQEPGGALLHSVGRDITERKRADRALRANQAFLHRTSEVAGIGGWEVDLRSGETIWSEQVRRILEVDEDYVPRREDAIASYAPEARETLQKAWNDCVERGVAWDLELPRYTATGRRICVRTVGSLELELGQPRRVVGALQDVTERKLLEQRLADGERFLRQITDHLPVRIAYFDAHARYRFVNRAHCEHYGRSREEIIGRTRAELSGGSGDGVIGPRVQEVLRGTPQSFEYEETLQGVTRRIQSQLIPDVGEDGRVRGFYATGIDVTERVANERQLREQTATLRSVTEALPAMVAVVGADGRYRFVNAAFARWAGEEPSALLGRRVADVIEPREYAARAPWIARALAGEHVSFRTSDPERAMRHLAITYVPLRSDGVIDGYVGVAQDITAHSEPPAPRQQLP